ncbi:MAG: hypothetical protein R6V11_08090 [Ectothiorhodospiraceae bacterium]
MSTDNEPLTPGEARRHETPMRRDLWIGLGVLAAVVVLLIMVVMEARYRDSLDDPRPSAALDGAMESVIAELAPLPAPVAHIEIHTRNRSGGQYQVVLENGDGEALFDITRSADSAGTVTQGERTGKPIRFDVDLTLNDDGTVSGHYQPDRGVAVARYRAVAGQMVREALVAWHAHASHELPEVSAESEETIRSNWDAVMDRDSGGGH